LPRKASAWGWTDSMENEVEVCEMPTYWTEIQLPKWKAIS